MTATCSPLAEFRKVVKTYTHPFFSARNVDAVKDVSFQIQPGEVFGLLGPNRAGKTTLVKILLSLCSPTSGEVSRLERPLSDRNTLAEIGYVHEKHAFPRYLTAEGLLEYYGALSFVSQEHLTERIPQLLERVGLADRSREPISRFSKGMLQRLGLAQALINEPRLLVLDEPTEGLDLGGRSMMREVVREIREKQGSVLLVTHVLSEVEQLCDRVGVMVNGHLAHLGTKDELLTDSGTKKKRSLEKALEALYSRSNA